MTTEVAIDILDVPEGARQGVAVAMFRKAIGVTMDHLHEHVRNHEPENFDIGEALATAFVTEIENAGWVWDPGEREKWEAVGAPCTEKGEGSMTPRILTASDCEEIEARAAVKCHRKDGCACDEAELPKAHSGRLLCIYRHVADSEKLAALATIAAMQEALGLLVPIVEEHRDSIVESHSYLSDEDHLPIDGTLDEAVKPIVAAMDAALAVAARVLSPAVPPQET